MREIKFRAWDKTYINNVSTREEAKALLGSTALLMFEHNGSSTLDGDKTLHIIDKIFDEHYLEMKAKDEEIERLKSYIEKLWQIVDDIDTYGDMAKSNNAMFRSLVENKQKERWELPITTDGYKLIYKDNS